jgi:hypothetical protein
VSAQWPSELRRRVQKAITDEVAKGPYRSRFGHESPRHPSNKENLNILVQDVIQEWDAEQLLLDMDRKMELP